jgi:hypothetical protein
MRVMFLFMTLPKFSVMRRKARTWSRTKSLSFQVTSFRSQGMGSNLGQQPVSVLTPSFVLPPERYARAVCPGNMHGRSVASSIPGVAE